MEPKLGYLETVTFIKASVLWKYSDVNQTIVEPETVELSEFAINSIDENSFAIGDKQSV